MSKKVTKPKAEPKPKTAASIFDHIKNITESKVPWSALSEADRKSFSPYIVNRWLSMNSGLIELINECQQYTIGGMQPGHVYELYRELLPKQKLYLKYVKGSKAPKYNDRLIELITNHLQCSERECEDYLDILSKRDDFKDIVESLAKMYALNESEIKKLFS
jgi:hypothetical protein